MDDLVAYRDGELDAPRHEQVRRLVRQDPTWRQAYEQMQAVDGLLDAYEAPPASPELAGRVIEHVYDADRRRARLVWFARFAAPIAAAAAILLLALIVRNALTGRVEEPVGPAPAVVTEDPPTGIDKVLEDVPAEDRFVVAYYEMFRDLDVVENFEVLQAIDRLEAERDWN